MKAQLIFLELFTFLHDIFWQVKICLDINFHEERIFGTLVKVNRLLILIESCSAIVQQVIIYLDINFHEERILSILVKRVIICLNISFHEERILSILVKVS
ncbi:unnamed protein product [Rhizophagus irregularis]|nr:unnamed protein product [Rhizophagus irregularis]